MTSFIRPWALLLVLAGCASPPPELRPDVSSPPDWTQWRTGDDTLHAAIATDAGWALAWWTVLRDPVLDDLQRRALDANPDLRTAALHFAQARTQRGVVGTQDGFQAGVSAGVVRQRQSENSAGIRLIDVIGGDRERLSKLLAEPFTMYQAAFDVSWEPDFWGRVANAVAAADADVAAQAALLDVARLTVASDVARHYLDWRATGDQRAVLRDDIAAQRERIALQQARVDAGLVDHLDLERQRADLAATEAQLAPLAARQAASAGQLELLLGERPGALSALLAAPSAPLAELPDLALGLPSDLARRRPDLLAADARLRRATANIGVARADLYPSIRIGGKFGFESYLSDEFASWGSRTWSIGPTLDLPLFDRGRRVRTVQLRELAQQEAAVDYQRTVLKAWHEIDDALNAYTAERTQLQRLQAREAHAHDAHALALSRHDAGTLDFTPVLDSQRSLLQARRDRQSSEARTRTQFVVLNKAIAAMPVADALPSQAAADRRAPGEE